MMIFNIARGCVIGHRPTGTETTRPRTKHIKHGNGDQAGVFGSERITDSLPLPRCYHLLNLQIRATVRQALYPSNTSSQRMNQGNTKFLMTMEVQLAENHWETKYELKCGGKRYFDRNPEDDNIN